MLEEDYKKYLGELPEDRRPEIERVWKVIRENVSPDFTEETGGKFLIFKADGEHYIALANQKNYISLYLMPIYIFPELKSKFDLAGKNLKCGKSCVNFKKASELPLEVIGEIIAANNAETYKKQMLKARAEARK